MKTEYDSNNSGGKWWLTDEDWKALEAAGWDVEWRAVKYQQDVANGEKFAELGKPDKDGRWLGALATKASRQGLALKEAVAEWERITGKDSLDAGCACCGNPHNFTEYDDNDKWVASGPEFEYRG